MTMLAHWQLKCHGAKKKAQAEQKKADGGHNSGTTQLTPPMIDITCERQQQTGSKCKRMNLTDQKNEKHENPCMRCVQTSRSSIRVAHRACAKGRGGTSRGAQGTPSPGKVCRAPTSHGMGAAQGEATLQNFDSESTDDSSTGPTSGQSKRRATPTDCLTPTLKFQRARRQSLKTDSLSALPARGWDEMTYAECAADRGNPGCPQSTPTDL